MFRFLHQTLNKPDSWVVWCLAGGCLSAARFNLASTWMGDRLLDALIALVQLWRSYFKPHVKWQMDGFSKSELNGTISAGGTEAVMHSIQPHGIDPIIIDLILLRSAILWYIIPWVLKICHPGDVRDDLKFVWDVLQKIPTKFYQLTNFFRFCAPLKHEIPQTHFNWYFWHLGYIS